MPLSARNALLPVPYQLDFEANPKSFSSEIGLGSSHLPLIPKKEKAEELFAPSVSTII
jgi:hypothetical protein